MMPGQRPPGFKGLVDDALGILTDCLGEKVEYRSCKGGIETIDAVFDRDYVAVDPDTERVISSNSPMIGVRLRDLPSKPVKGDIVVIGSEEFQVIDSREDGQGGAALFLHIVECDE